jgi:hypothetical protein
VTEDSSRTHLVGWVGGCLKKSARMIETACLQAEDIDLKFQLRMLKENNSSETKQCKIWWICSY